MKKLHRLNPLAASIGAAVVASALTTSAQGEVLSPFTAVDLSSGYNLATQDGKETEGKCGEGKCGEGMCGEGKCGGDTKTDTEGKCGEGKCGEGKCGGEKTDMEGTCGGNE
tara:strand:+ start:129 stop:461 length:333 start_codon:yes stop_codon:yes gene_type:complete